MDSERINLLYLVLVLVILVSGLVSRRDMPLSKIAKYLFLWTIIALGAVLLYSFRYEFEHFKERIASELLPSRATINHENRQIIVKASQDGHYYLNVNINNKPVMFMIDTGASDIVLNQKDAKSAGINFNSLVFNKRYETANGAVMGASIIIESFEISGIFIKNVRASVNSGELDVSLLGIDFLKRFKKYEFYQDKLIISF